MSQAACFLVLYFGAPLVASKPRRSVVATLSGQAHVDANATSIITLEDRQWHRWFCMSASLVSPLGIVESFVFWQVPPGISLRDFEITGADFGLSSCDLIITVVIRRRRSLCYYFSARGPRRSC